MTVTIKPNNKCSNCRNYVDGKCLARSVPRFCGARYLPIKPPDVEKKAKEKG